MTVLWNKRCFCLCIPRLICILLNVGNVITKLCGSLDLPQIHYIYLAGKNRVRNTNSLLPSVYLSLRYFNFFLCLCPCVSATTHSPLETRFVTSFDTYNENLCPFCTETVPGKHAFMQNPFSAFPNTHKIFFWHHSDFKIVLCNLNKISKNSNLLQG